MPYYFLKNLQGDVIAIVDKNANTVARYSYDAWGVPTATQIAYGNIAEINPFRYRSYYYDEEIEMYYLQSRYYDANVGRFVNTDDIAIAIISSWGTNGSYTYCENNCLNNQDPFGFYKVSILVRTPDINSTVAWGFDKNGNFTAGHAFMVLDPEKATNCGGIIRKGFGMADSNGIIKNTLLRATVNGKIYDENNYDDFHAYVTYPNITLRQYLTIKNHLNQSSPPKYNIVNYNCVNFVIEALEKAGIKHLFQKSFWNLGLFGNIIVAGSLGLYIFAINNLNMGLVAISLHFAAFATAYGYYPAKFAYDINRGVK